MALTFVEDYATQGLGVSATISISSSDWKLGDLISVVVNFASSASVTAESISNDGTPIDWLSVETAAGVANCRLTLFLGVVKGPVAPTQISVTATAGALLTCRKALFVAAHRGFFSNNPATMAQNVWIGTGGADVTQEIPASGHGSCFWFVCGDTSATNTFGPAANCDLLHTFDNASFTGAVIAPTQHPLQSGNAFMIGESDTGARVAWIAFEIRAAPDYWLMGQAML